MDYIAVYTGTGPRIEGRGNTADEALANAKAAYQAHYREAPPGDSAFTVTGP